MFYKNAYDILVTQLQFQFSNSCYMFCQILNYILSKHGQHTRNNSKMIKLDTWEGQTLIQIYTHYKNKYCNKIFYCNKLKIFVINNYCNETNSLHTIAIKSVAINYYNKNLVAIVFCCNKISLLLLKIIFVTKISLL